MMQLIENLVSSYSDICLYLYDGTFAFGITSTATDEIYPFFLFAEKMKSCCKWIVLKWNIYFQLLLITFRYKRLTISSFLIPSLLARGLIMVIGEFEHFRYNETCVTDAT